MCTIQHQVPLLAGGHGTASQRCTDIIHSVHSGRRKNCKKPSAKEKSSVFLFLPPPPPSPLSSSSSSSSSLWFVNTSVSLRQLPGLYLITIKHLHEKVDKGWNSGGGLATKRPIYRVQSGRDMEREGRRRSWEESWINELKMSWNSGWGNIWGVYIVRHCSGVELGGVSSRRSGQHRLLSHRRWAHMQQEALIWLHNGPVTVSQNRYRQCQCTRRHWTDRWLLLVQASAVGVVQLWFFLSPERFTL